MDNLQLRDEPFPAPSKKIMGTIDSEDTEALSMYFADKIVVTLSQEGRLAQWVCGNFQQPLASCLTARLTTMLDTSASF
jgi:hypothetical protein